MKHFRYYIIIILVVLLTSLSKGQTIEIHQIDVGTGDAALINIRDNMNVIEYSILIDAGETNMNENVIEYLKTNAKQVNGYVYLDYVILSHYHSDHMGGLVGQKETYYQDPSSGKRRKCAPFYTGVLGDTIIKFFAVLDKGPSIPQGDSKLYGTYKTLAGARRITVGSSTVGSFFAIDTIKAPQTFPPPLPGFTQGLSLGGFIDLGQDINNVPIRLRLILADSKVYYPGGPGNTYNVADTLGALWGKNLRKKRDNPNNWGLGWVLEYGAFRYYTAGDVGGYDDSYSTCISCGSNYFDIETPMALAFPLIYTAPANAQGHICAQKVSHHGSCCSSNSRFLDTLKSSVAIISAGPSTKFGHPTQEVITRLEATRWDRDSLRRDSLYAYFMTELFFENRNIKLSTGSTSGSKLLVATNLPVNLPDTEATYTMVNGDSLYKFKNTIPIEDGDVIIKVDEQNAQGNTNITAKFLYSRISLV
jgi:competence protein ComEC